MTHSKKMMENQSEAETFVFNVKSLSFCETIDFCVNSLSFCEIIDFYTGIHAISRPHRSKPFKSKKVRTPLAKAVWGTTPPSTHTYFSSCDPWLAGARYQRLRRTEDSFRYNTGAQRAVLREHACCAPVPHFTASAGRPECSII